MELLEKLFLQLSVFFTITGGALLIGFKLLNPIRKPKGTDKEQMLTRLFNNHYVKVKATALIFLTLGLCGLFLNYTLLNPLFK